MSDPAGVEDQLRRLAPQVLGALARRYGHFDRCEDAVQEALVAASQQWPARGVPERPAGWLLTVAARRLTDELRREGGRRRREERVEVLAVGAAGAAAASGQDDSLALLFLCCHPALSPASQLALTLRAVGGLTTAEIARAFLVPEATMAQRISRAKQTIRAAGADFRLPDEQERPARLRVVLHVLYLVGSEGYLATSGPVLHRSELAAEAIRLCRLLRELLPDDPEVAGLLALTLLTEARAAARVDGNGCLVPIPEQDRSRWDPALIDEGVALLTEVLPKGPVGSYQLQAAIAAVHDEAASAEETDWPQILGLYDLLERIAPNPVVSLNRAVALANVAGPHAALAAVAAIEAAGDLAGHHRLAAVRGHLLELAGDPVGAEVQYRLASRGSTVQAERRHLERRAARLRG